ncbi:MAG: acyl-CoA/acyl-ACP dehydrogenase [Acidobacteria bacterium]|nr:acyl-CoA/acyl-ACP dehydrogenase [Acidobacteriota bacterium]
MELQLSEDQEFFRDTTRKFLDAEAPLTKVRALEASDDGFERDWWRRGAELGWTSMLVPEDLGGGSLSGAGLLDLVLVAEEMGRLVAPGPLVPVSVVASAIAAGGNAEQQKAVLPGLLAGATFAAWALDEGRGPWSGAGVTLTAEQRGSDFILNGTKSTVEAGNVADHFLVTVRTGAGLTNLLVPAGAPGLTVVPMKSLDLVRRFSRVDFSDVTVPSSASVGEIGGAGGEVDRLLQTAVVLQCHETNGAVDHVFAMTTEYAGDRYSFGRPLSSYQALKHRFADLKLWLEGSHGIATHAARAVQQRAANAAELSSAAKSYVGENSTDIIQDCIQLHGGIGVTWEHDLHLFLRRATVNRVTYGTPADHRERIATLLSLEEG